MNKVSEFSYYLQPISTTKPNAVWTIVDVYNKVSGPSLCDITKKIRACQTITKMDDMKDKHLPFVTFAGVFSYRSKEKISQRSCYIVVDVDKLSEKGFNLAELRQEIKDKIKPVLMFVSPKGNGLKVICRIDPSGDWDEYYFAFREFFRQVFSRDLVDTTGKNLSRACYLCHDPEVFMSDNPTLYDLGFMNKYAKSGKTAVQKPPEDIPMPEHHQFDELYRRGKVYMEKKNMYQFEVGSRHCYIAEFAGYLNRTGVFKQYALDCLLEFERPDFNFEADEISGIVERIYNHKEWFGIAPMKVGIAKDYISFPLRMLWGPREQFLDRIKTILSDSFERTSHELPTSIKISYLESALKDQIDPDLLLLIAALGNILYKKNYNFTTRPTIFLRMFGGKPGKRYTDYSVRQLLKKAINRGFMVALKHKKNDRWGIYVSTRYSATELGKAICDNYEKTNRRYLDCQDAASKISEFKKGLFQRKQAILT